MVSNNLVIVESPAKAKTIKKILGEDYIVESCFGHIVNLTKKNMGVNLDTYDPIYEITDDKKKIVEKLKTLCTNVKCIWLASDEDREGEAISWHLYNFLGLSYKNTKRIVFNEITKKAILNSIKNPREIDVNLVNAQQARRIIDRLVGFQISPILWKKIKTGLSAGRVQSVAVRLIVEKENEINVYNIESSYKIKATFSLLKNTFHAILNHSFTQLNEVKDFLITCKNSNFKVVDIIEKESYRSPSPPFTTSTLQQEASSKLGFSVSKTMRIAQKLYEMGYITYMRTDSTHISEDFILDIKNYIISQYGIKYFTKRIHKNKNISAQEAHEAIRPTSINLKIVEKEVDMDKLYNLIWKRTLSSQMSDCILKKIEINISNDTKYIFQSKGDTIIFEGFHKIWGSNNKTTNLIPNLKLGQYLTLLSIEGREIFSNPPSRYTEASLVKKLEDLGIGRPSTYAPTISVIQNRGYVNISRDKSIDRKYKFINLLDNEVIIEDRIEKVNYKLNKLIPTDIGIIVNNFLIQNFSNIISYNFTANIEEYFDQIARGDIFWKDIIENFYLNFSKDINKVDKESIKVNKEVFLGIDPISKKNVYAKIGKYGAFIQMDPYKEGEKPKFAKILKGSIYTITLEEALKLFKFPKELGTYENKKVIVNIGKYGPYIIFDQSFISIPKELDIDNINLADAINLIQENRNKNVPILNYEENDVFLAIGRYGPYIKWNNLFITIPNKFHIDKISHSEIIDLIEKRKNKDKEKIILNWENEGIRVEKGRWKRYNIIYKNIKIEISKDTDINSLTLEKVKHIITSNNKKLR